MMQHALVVAKPHESVITGIHIAVTLLQALVLRLLGLGAADEDSRVDYKVGALESQQIPVCVCVCV